MRLYHPVLLLISALAFLLAACITSPQVNQGEITVAVIADGEQREVRLSAGSTAQEAIVAAGLVPSSLDRIDPPGPTLLSDGAEVRLIRVKETFEIQQVVIPFENQVIYSDSLLEGESRLIQPGKNGLQEVTLRHLYEDGELVSTTTVKTVIVEEAVPEIMMFGRHTSYAPLTIPGRLVYLANGNAWLMEGTTANRRPLTQSSDLDGRVFRLSPDGEWLLYSRKVDEESQINALWVLRIDGELKFGLGLEASNVIHFADWDPVNPLTVVYSSVEPRSTAPGWQANNDLHQITFDPGGELSEPRLLLETNTGGIYGWWGITFLWSPAGERLAYARPDSVGLFDQDANALTPWMANPPYRTSGDWVWLPGLGWGADGRVLFSVAHAPGEQGLEAEASPRFDLVALPLNGSPVALVPNVGMFANPVPSPAMGSSWETSGYLVTYLQALFPDQSLTSRYRLMLMDRDGSNKQALFPETGAPGLEPQRVSWSPKPLDSFESYVIALIYQGDIWLIDITQGKAYQVTAGTSVKRLDWR